MKQRVILLCGILFAFSLIFMSCEEDRDEFIKESSAAKELKSYQSGTHDGYFWSLWTDDASGWVNYQNGSGGNYSVSWDYDGNFTCGKGWSSGSLTRVIGYNCGAFTMNGGGTFGYYGWSKNPLMEYYVNEKWGSSRPAGGTYLGTITSDGATYDVYTSMRYNAPSIEGTQTFRQIYSTRRNQAPTGQNLTITFANHANAWRNFGYGLGSDLSPAAILLTEAYGGNASGYVNATVWEAGNSSGSSGGSGGGSSYPVGTELPITLRARSTDGQGQVRLVVGDKTVATWTLGTSMADYHVSLWVSRGEIRLDFINDASGRDVQVDYLKVGNEIRQAENMPWNSAVWENGSCGGDYSEWMHCNGSIGFYSTP